MHLTYKAVFDFLPQFLLHCFRSSRGTSFFRHIVKRRTSLSSKWFSSCYIMAEAHSARNNESDTVWYDRDHHRPLHHHHVQVRKVNIAGERSSQLKGRTRVSRHYWFIKTGVLRGWVGVCVCVCWSNRDSYQQFDTWCPRDGCDVPRVNDRQWCGRAKGWFLIAQACKFFCVINRYTHPECNSSLWF